MTGVLGGRAAGGKERDVAASVKRVGVVGGGTMGSGIAQVFAQSDHQVTLLEASPELLDRGLRAIRRNLDGLLERGKLGATERDQAWGRLTGTTRLEDVEDADLVIEAITENQTLKNETFAKLDAICPPHTILASNTSSCNITAMAAATKRPRKVLGLHFFNPAPLMKLVEVVDTILTDQETVLEARSWVQAAGKLPVEAKDTTGFIVNRLLVPYLLEAIRLYESGVATKEDIDQAMKFGCGYPMGPFALLDMVGLDTTLYVAEVMFEEFREARFAPPPLLKRMVAAGFLGRKSGRGFYDYAQK